MAEVKQRLFTIRETMTILSRSYSSIWRDIEAERLDIVHIGRSVRVTGNSIDKLCTVGAGLVPKRPALRLAASKTPK